MLITYHDHDYDIILVAKSMQRMAKIHNGSAIGNGTTAPVCISFPTLSDAMNFIDSCGLYDLGVEFANSVTHVDGAVSLLVELGAYLIGADHMQLPI
jgi:hypothetical protein